MAKRKKSRLQLKRRARLRSPLAIAVIGFAIAGGSVAVLHSLADVQPVGVTGNWGLVFDDEFNESSLTPGTWASTWFNGGSMNNVSTSASNESVSGGNLNLQLGSSGSGALVNTDPKQAGTGFQFGTGYFVEARIFFPGSGSTIDNWPAFWADGQSWPTDGEIDIAEGLGTLTSNYHSPSGANNSGTIGGSWGGSWHTYAVDRESGKNYIYWDGKMVRSYSSNDGGSPEYLILNVGNGSGPTVTGANGALKVDYVRVWKANAASTVTPPPTPAPTVAPPARTATPIPKPVTSTGGGSSTGTGTTATGTATNATASPSASPGSTSGMGSSSGNMSTSTSSSDVVIEPTSAGVVTAGSVPTVSGKVTLAVPTGATNAKVLVDGVVVSNGSVLDTTYLTNGSHTVTIDYSLSGTGSQSTQMVNVQNHLSAWQNLRNHLFAFLHGNQSETNIAVVLTVLIVVGSLAFVSFKVLAKRRPGSNYNGF